MSEDFDLNGYLDQVLPDTRGTDQINNPQPTKGFRLLMPFSVEGTWWKSNPGYYRHGFKHDLRAWLLEQVGPTGTYVDWEGENMEVRWIHTGSNQLNLQARQAIGFNEMAVFRFRDKRDAMLMKLTWWGRM